MNVVGMALTAPSHAVPHLGSEAAELIQAMRKYRLRICITPRVRYYRGDFAETRMQCMIMITMDVYTNLLSAYMDSESMIFTILLCGLMTANTQGQIELLLYRSNLDCELHHNDIIRFITSSTLAAPQEVIVDEYGSPYHNSLHPSNQK